MTTWTWLLIGGCGLWLMAAAIVARSLLVDSRHSHTEEDLDGL